MESQTPPLDQRLPRYEPTPTDLAFAADILDDAKYLNTSFVLGTLEACLNAAARGEPVDLQVRRGLAFLAEWDKRRGAVES